MSSKTITGNLDWRSLLIGLLIGIITIMVSGQNLQNHDLQRYTAASIANDIYAIFIVDTYTGQAWRMDMDETVDYGTPAKPEVGNWVAPPESRF